jgi:hypothetical protein
MENMKHIKTYENFSLTNEGIFDKIGGKVKSFFNKSKETKKDESDLKKRELEERVSKRNKEYEDESDLKKKELEERVSKRNKEYEDQLKYEEWERERGGFGRK